jgi:hypothetical protein
LLREDCNDLRDHLLPLLIIGRVSKSMDVVDPIEAVAKLEARENAQVAPRGGTVLVGSGRTCLANQNLGVARASTHQFWFSFVNRIPFLSFDNPTSSTNHQQNGQVSVRFVNVAYNNHPYADNHNAAPTASPRRTSRSRRRSSRSRRPTRRSTTSVPLTHKRSVRCDESSPMICESG